MRVGSAGRRRGKMTEVSRDMLQRIGYDNRGSSSLESVVRTIRGNVITAAARGQRWWIEEVFDGSAGRGAVTTALVRAVMEELVRSFPGVSIRYVLEGGLRRILEIDWS